MATNSKALPSAGSLVPSTTKLAHRVDVMQREAYLRSRGIDPNQPFQLEIWPDDVREMPNDYARSAIFTVRNKTEPRASLQGALVFHVEKAVKITFTGIELRAEDDELVWQQILNYAKVKPLGEPIEFNLHELCRDLNWSINGRNYEKARMSISRLKANEVKLENERIGRGSAISLIHNYTFQGDGAKGTKYCVWIHPDLILLFAGNTSTRIVWTKYRDLPPIARRLYDYFASHKQPFPLRLDTFLKMCASTCGTEKKWRSMVRDACARLVAANLVKKAWIHADCVFCER
jgi:TrfA protein